MECAPLAHLLELPLCLHLLREDSIDRAVQAIAQPEDIFEANMKTMRSLGRDGWDALDIGPSQ